MQKIDGEEGEQADQDQVAEEKGNFAHGHSFFPWGGAQEGLRGFSQEARLHIGWSILSSFMLFFCMSIHSGLASL